MLHPASMSCLQDEYQPSINEPNCNQPSFPRKGYAGYVEGAQNIGSEGTVLPHPSMELCGQTFLTPTQAGSIKRYHQTVVCGVCNRARGSTACVVVSTNRVADQGRTSWPLRLGSCEFGCLDKALIMTSSINSRAPQNMLEGSTSAVRTFRRYAKGCMVAYLDRK